MIGFHVMTTYWRNSAFSVTLAILYLSIWLFIGCSVGIIALSPLDPKGPRWGGLVLLIVGLIGTLANVGMPVASFITRRAILGPDSVTITQLGEEPLTIPYSDIHSVEKGSGGDIHVWGKRSSVVVAPPKRRSKRSRAHPASIEQKELYYIDRFTFWELTGLGKAIAERAGKPFLER